jgi:hypothetical protein
VTLKPTGGPWGGIIVDEEFFSKLEDMFGEDVLSSFMQNYPEDLLEVKRGFESKKCVIKESSNDQITIKIVPILFPRNFLLENNIFKWFIISSTDFVKHSFMKSFLNRTLSLAVFAIVKGAVMFGNNPCLIQERISPRTYGICVNEPFDSTQHPTHLKCIVEGQEKCTDIFKIIVIRHTCFIHFYRGFSIIRMRRITMDIKYAFSNNKLLTLIHNDFEYIRTFVMFGNNPRLIQERISQEHTGYVSMDHSIVHNIHHT